MWRLEYAALAFTQTYEEPKILFDFANPFFNDPDWQGSESNPYPSPFNPGLSGIAFPLYERTEISLSAINAYQGAFLGWIILQPKGDAESFSKDSLLDNFQGESIVNEWPKIAMALNSLADAILIALTDEVVSEYSNHSEYAPLKYLCNRLEDLGGFRVAKDGDTDNVVQLLISADKKNEGSVRYKEIVKIVGKGSTLFSVSDEAYKDNHLFPRIQRTFRQLEAVHLSRQAQTLLKYKHLLDALANPLNNLSDALTSMQRDTQELRAILYEPTQTIFESYQRISELFEEGAEVRFSKDINAVIAHEPRFYTEHRSWEVDITSEDRVKSIETGKMCLITAIFRIFGIDRPLHEAQNYPALLKLAKEELAKTTAPVFNYLRRDVEWLIGTKLNKEGWKLDFIFLAYGDSKFTAEQVVDALDAIKAVAFSPFKIQTSDWHVLALQLAIPYEGRDSVHIVPAGHKKLKLGHWSPVGFNKVLEFLRAIIASDLMQGNAKNILIKEENVDNATVTTISAQFVIRGKYSLADETIQLRKLLSIVLQEVNDFRISASNRGSFHGPFVSFANSIIGMENTKGGEWRMDERSLKDNTVLAIHSLNGNNSFLVRLSHVQGDTGELKIQWSEK